MFAGYFKKLAGLIIDVGHRSMTDDKMYLTDVHAFLSVKVTDVTK